jgi:toxin ParE1/3/4
MSARYVLTQEANRDLLAIADHIAQESSLAAAEGVIIEFRRTFQLLADQPGVGHAREDLTSEPRFRFWVLFSYLIAFVPCEKPLPIVAIVHGTRDPGAIAEGIRAALENDTKRLHP